MLPLILSREKLPVFPADLNFAKGILSQRLAQLLLMRRNNPEIQSNAPETERPCTGILTDFPAAKGLYFRPCQ